MGTVFQLDEQEYKTAKKIYYTHSLDDQITKEVKDDGTLEVINQDDVVIKSFPLEKIKKEVIKTNTDREIVKNEPKDENLFIENNFTKVAIYVLLLVIIGIVLYLRTGKKN